MADESDDGGIPFDEDKTPWKPWSPAEATTELSKITTPVRWAVAGGWALDLFLGRITRAHEDLEIVVLADDVPEVLDEFASPQWRWYVPTDGWLHPLDSPLYRQSHQTWLWSDVDRAFVLDVFRDQHDGDTWICRRDPTMTMPWSEAHHDATTPYLVPEIVLLFKAKHSRAKDEQDLRTVLPALTTEQRAWLRTAIERVHPGHAWLQVIAP
jgi:hypothetical protein